MTVTHREWLPDMALFDGVLRARVLECARVWSRRWFTAPKDISVKVEAGGHTSRAIVTGWGTPCHGVVLGLDEDTPLRLACALLKIRTPSDRLSAVDSRLLRGVSAACIGDLMSVLAAAFGLPKETGPLAALDVRDIGRTAAMRLTLAVPAFSRHFVLYLSQDKTVSARKAQIPPAREPRKLGVLRSAVEAQEVKVGACIGWARTPLADLRSLEPDDVMVLDEVLGKALTLLVNGKATTDSGIELVQAGSTLVLRERKAESRA